MRSQSHRSPRCDLNRTEAQHTEPHHPTMKLTSGEGVQPFLCFLLYLMETTRAATGWACHHSQRLLSIVHRFVRYWCRCSVWHGNCDASPSILMVCNVLPSSFLPTTQNPEDGKSISLALDCPPLQSEAFPSCQWTVAKTGVPPTPTCCAPYSDGSSLCH
jgi:hypothetical protein